jgi:hypothetical protein
MYVSPVLILKIFILYWLSVCCLRILKALKAAVVESGFLIRVED